MDLSSFNTYATYIEDYICPILRYTIGTTVLEVYPKTEEYRITRTTVHGAERWSLKTLSFQDTDVLLEVLIDIKKLEDTHGAI